MAKQILYSAFVLLVMGCSTSQKGSNTVSNGSNSDRMKQMVVAAQDLFPLVVDDGAFGAKENQSTIDKNLLKLSQISHQVNMDAAKHKMPGSEVDPAVSVLSGSLTKDFALALDSYRSNQFEYSRSIARTALQVCVQCHTRGESSERGGWVKPETLSGLKPLERAELFTITREYDKAIDNYMLILQGKTTTRESFDIEKAANMALRIAIRAKKDPAKASQISELVLKSNLGSNFLRHDAQQWLSHIQSWQAEGSTRLSGNKLFLKAQQLIKNARSNTYLQTGHAGRSTTVLYSRAAGLLHDYLKSNPSTLNGAEAYLLLGDSYVVMKDPGSVGLGKTYYRACIFTAPHTQVAMQCYDRLEEETYMESISGGMNISNSTIEYLDYLRGQAASH